MPPARILIVDDEPFKRDVLIQELEILDHEGLTAIHGRDALDQLSCDTVDLILLDIHDAGNGGFGVLRRLKDAARLRDIPVIMISALDDLDSGGALHSPRRRGTPAQVVQPGAAQGADRRLSREEVLARSGGGVSGADRA